MEAAAPIGEPLLLSVEQAAEKLGIGRTLMYDLIGRRQVRTVRIGRCRRVAALDLEDFVQKLRDEVRPAASFGPDQLDGRPLLRRAGTPLEVDGRMSTPTGSRRG